MKALLDVGKSELSFTRNIDKINLGDYPTIDANKGIRWFTAWGNKKFAKRAVMMIRPVS